MKPAAEGVNVTVTAFRFAGNAIIPSAELEPVVSSYLNRPLSFIELQNAAADVAEAYRKAGWVVRAYLPQQDIVDGNITIQIVEAMFGGVHLEGNPPERLRLDRAMHMVESAQAVGAPLNGDKLDRALLLLDDLPGVAAAGTITEGKAQGETDLLLKLADEPWLTGEAGLDNTGSRSTGSDRVTANAYLNSPLKFGDLLSVNAIHSRGNDYLRLAYTLPVGNDGWRIGASGSYLNYDLVKGTGAGLGTGDSSSLGLDASYPIIRSRQKNLYLGINYDHKTFDNELGVVTTSRYDINNVGISLNGNLFDKIGGGGANAGGLVLTRGVKHDFTASQGGSFCKLQYNLSRQQYLTDTFSLFGAVSGQLGDSGLDSAEKFYLGGASGVRAYPSSEGGGSQGQMVNLELRARLPKNFVVTGFYDIGHVHDTGTVPNDYTLQGAGISAAWVAEFGLSLRATLAHRIGDNPNPSATGADQDGSKHMNRFWLQAMMPF